MSRIRRGSDDDLLGGGGGGGGAAAKKNFNKFSNPPAPSSSSTAGGGGSGGGGVLLKQGQSCIPEEDDEGSIEYKWRLVGVTEQRLNHLVTQMKYRVTEGRGECIYEIGVEDDGYTRGLPQAEFDESIATLRTMAARLDFTLSINCVVSRTDPETSQVFKCAEVRVRKIVDTLPTCRIAVVGDTNSGKSTVVGVIASGALDDGSGTVRQSVFRHKHELKSGQTSSVCDRVVGFRADGQIVNYDGDEASQTGSAASSMADRNCNDFIAERSATLCMLMDLPGHLKRSHTALAALVGRFPHCVVIVVNPNAHENVSTHIAQCAALHLPFFVMFTHQDATTPQVLGQAAAAVDRAVGNETGKRVVMVSSPIYPGENEGFNHREMIHTSSDLFLSDLASTASNERGSPMKSDVEDAGDRDGSDDGNGGGGGGGGGGIVTMMARSPRDENGFQNHNHNHNNNGLTPYPTPQRPAASTAATATTTTTLSHAALLHNNKMRPSRNPVDVYLESHVPVFVVSSVTGYGVQLFKHFLHQLSLCPPRLTIDECDSASVMPPMNYKSRQDGGGGGSGGGSNSPSTVSPTNNGSKPNSPCVMAASTTSTTDLQRSGGGDGGVASANSDEAEQINKKLRFDFPTTPTVPVPNGAMPATTTTTTTAQPTTSSSTTTPSILLQTPSPQTTGGDSMVFPSTIRVCIDRVFSVQKAGLIAAGTVTSGTLQVGQNLFWGPSKSGGFFPVKVASLHYQRNFVRSVGSGNECAVAFEGGDEFPPDLVAMSQRKGTMLFGSSDNRALPPAISRDFRVIVSKARAVATAQELFKVDLELTAFVFSAKQSVFIRKIEGVDFSSEEYAAVHKARSIGDASRPLILHCSFVFFPEILAVGAPIVLLRNTPDGRLGAVGGRIFSFDACVAREKSSQSASSEQSVTPPRSPTQQNYNVVNKDSNCGSSDAAPAAASTKSNSAQASSLQQPQQFPTVGKLPEKSDMAKPVTSSPPNTPTTSPPPAPVQTGSSMGSSSLAGAAASAAAAAAAGGHNNVVLDPADMSVAAQRAQRKLDRLKEKERSSSN